jgi:hypothetical protein
MIIHLKYPVPRSGVPASFQLKFFPDYLSVTLAPSASSLASDDLQLSAFVKAFLNNLRSSLNKILGFLQSKTCNSRTTLITLILEAPTSVSSTSNSVFSSAAAPAPAPAAATTTPAAADTPNFSSQAFTRSLSSSNAQFRYSIDKFIC